MLKDKEVFEALIDKYSIENVYQASNPSKFLIEQDYKIIFTESYNRPNDWADGKVLAYISNYDIDVYSKEPDTILYRENIDKILEGIGFVRISSTRETYEESSEYYRRMLVYKTKV